MRGCDSVTVDGIGDRVGARVTLVLSASGGGLALVLAPHKNPKNAPGLLAHMHVKSPCQSTGCCVYVSTWIHDLGYPRARRMAPYPSHVAPYPSHVAGCEGGTGATQPNGAPGLLAHIRNLNITVFATFRRLLCGRTHRAVSHAFQDECVVQHVATYCSVF